MASGKVDPDKLARHAAHAVSKGNFDRAAELYARLERLEPEEPTWPREQAMVHRLANRHSEELDALLRCAGLEASSGALAPALTTCKMILSIDPGHGPAQVLLTKLQPDQAVSVDYDDDPGELEDPAEDTATRSGRLDELVLTNIVDGARPASISEAALEGVHEIPLDRVVGEPPRRAPRQATSRGKTTKAQREIAAMLGNSPLFASLDPDALVQLARRAESVEVAAGDELFHQGDPPGALYFVANGAVVPIAEEEPRTRLSVLEPGEFIGEIALFTDQPRNATVEALVDTQLVAIDRPVMLRVVRKHPEVLSVLLGSLRDRLIDRLVRTSPLFGIFSGTKRSAITRRFRFLEVADGHRVIAQHCPAEAVFVLLAGQMEVVHEGDDESPSKVLAALAPGELFGEMSVLWREPSLASVFARGKCWLLALPARSFQEMLDHHPQLAAMAATIAEERRRENQQALGDDGDGDGA